MGTSKKRGNGEGTIFKREINGKTFWVTEYTIAMYDEKTGKRKRKTIYGKTRQEVKNKLEKIITELNTDSYVDKSKVKFKELTKEFIDNGYKLNQLSDSSYVRKLNTYNQICSHYMSDMEIQKITEDDLKDFLIYITKYSNSVIGKIYGVVNNTFKRAVRKNIIKYNFLDDKIEFCKPKSNKKDKSVHGFTIEEQKQFIQAIKNDTRFKYHYQFLLSLYTGMRMGEINALDKDLDIDFKNKVIHVRRTLTKDTTDKTIMGSYTKTKNGIRDIVMDEQVEFILKEYINKEYQPNTENLLFFNVKKNTYYTTGQINMVFKRFCEHYNIGKGYDVNQHMLRHTFATRCIEAGMPANVLSKVMGHADIRTTLEIYCDVFDNYEKQHSNRTYDYLNKNNLLLSQINDDNIPSEELDKIVNNIKKMYLKKDDKLIKILKLIA
jgi:integrase